MLIANKVVYQKTFDIYAKILTGTVEMKILNFAVKKYGVDYNL